MHISVFPEQKQNTIMPRLSDKIEHRYTRGPGFRRNDDTQFNWAYISVILIMTSIIIMTAYINDVILLVTLVSLGLAIVAVIIGSYARDTYTLSTFVTANGGPEKTLEKIRGAVSGGSLHSHPEIGANTSALMPRMNLQEIMSLT
jgi:hypothetical protein